MSTLRSVLESWLREGKTSRICCPVPPRARARQTQRRPVHTTVTPCSSTTWMPSVAPPALFEKGSQQVQSTSSLSVNAMHPIGPGDCSGRSITAPGGNFRDNPYGHKLEASIRIRARLSSLQHFLISFGQVWSGPPGGKPPMPKRCRNLAFDLRHMTNIRHPCR